jgi:hypothetical protein
MKTHLEKNDRGPIPLPTLVETEKGEHDSDHIWPNVVCEILMGLSRQQLTKLRNTAEHVENGFEKYLAGILAREYHLAFSCGV